MEEFTKERHKGTIGSTEPALCGAIPPGGRPWKEAPKDEAGAFTIPPCPECEWRHAILMGELWLAA